jgi:hypothetical protein
VVKQLREGVGVDGDMLGDVAVPVDDCWDFALRAQRMGSGRAELRSALDGKR